MDTTHPGVIPPPRFLPLGDSALSVEFGDRIDSGLLAAVTALDARLAAEAAAGRLPGVVETVPTYRSLAVLFDPDVTSWCDLQARITALLDSSLAATTAQGNRWRLPVCYDPGYGLDLERVAADRGLSPDEVVALHTGRTYTVYLIGFLPGFPYMGDVDEALRLPRLPEPRVRVPAGSVAIAGQQTAVYPWESPGGWNILGRCPLHLFDPRRPHPSLLGPGDRVAFERVSPDRYDELAGAVREGALDLERFVTREPLP